MLQKIELDLKVIIIAISLVLVAAVGSAYVTFLVFSRGAVKHAAVAESKGSQNNIFGQAHKIGDFTVNLQVPKGFAPRFVRCGLVLEVKDKQSISELVRREPQLRDVVISILRTKTLDDIAGASGMETLRSELSSAITALFPDEEIANVYFTELVVQ
ncbi:MAG: hypothetical protein GX316_10600 [Firmicutes bacterium]|nr:hypothetical protein [Bacillota bacterium]